MIKMNNIYNINIIQIWEEIKMNRTADLMMESQNYYQSNKRRVWILGAIVLFVAILLSVGFITKTVTAQRNSERVKLVTSIEIQKGDTLWSIASEYISDEYDDVTEFIEEIKTSNGMASEEIRVGNYIIVPYFADASR
jgi:cell division protein YceG involved in septum cleavage